MCRWNWHAVRQYILSNSDPAPLTQPPTMGLVLNQSIMWRKVILPRCLHNHLTERRFTTGKKGKHWSIIIHPIQCFAHLLMPPRMIAYWKPKNRRFNIAWVPTLCNLTACVGTRYQAAVPNQPAFHLIHVQACSFLPTRDLLNSIHDGNWPCFVNRNVVGWQTWQSAW